MPVSPPRTALPPLNALRAFETSARRQGFRAASEELGVTPAAISQQVRQLEEWAGVALFERRSRGVILTEDGTRVAAMLTEAFDAMGHAVAELRQASDAPPLRLATLPSVAQLWLPERLTRLRAALNGRQISVTALETPPNLLRAPYDMSLFLGPPGRGHLIAEDEVFPVCTPEIAGTIRTAADLARHVLLHDSAWATDWRDWAKETGTPLPNTDQGPHYSLYALVLAEAKAGAGIALGHRFLVDRVLEDATLIAPPAPVHRTGKALMLELNPAFSDADRDLVIDVLRRA